MLKTRNIIAIGGGGFGGSPGQGIIEQYILNQTRKKRKLPKLPKKKKLTFGEMKPSLKYRIDHRFKAFKKIKKFL